MAKISKQCIDKIKESIDILDVVSPYVTLKRCGTSWRGLSPFAQEKTPSFFAIPAKSMFKCFSTGYAGDIFRFIQLKENVSFVESVEMIASKFNISIEYDKTSQTEKEETFSKKELFEINEIANTLFVKNFNAESIFGNKIRNYWQNVRKFDLDFAKSNGIGLSQDNDYEMIKLLSQKNFSFEALKSCGLFYFKDGETKFSNFKMRIKSRLIIPIRDIQDKIVGFSARFVDGITPNNEFANAKYINTPETPIFHKGQLLFGINHARKFIERANEFWLVEGQIDAMRCWNCGLYTAIAPQGTAITASQLNILRRYSANINCLLDGDEAGFKAADRMLPMSFKAGLDLRIFILPNKQDPDEFFREDFDEKINILRQNSLSAMEYAMTRFLPNIDNVNAQEKADALQKIYEIILNSDSVVVQESCLDEISNISKSNRLAIASDFKTFSERLKFAKPMPSKFVIQKTVEKKSEKMLTAEAQLLSMILSFSELAKPISELFVCDWIENSDAQESKILLQVVNEIQADMWEGSSSIETILSDENEKNFVYSLLVDFETPDDIEFEINACLKKIHTTFMRNKILKIDKNISKVSLSQKEELKKLQTERLRLREKLLKHPRIKLGK